MNPPTQANPLGRKPKKYFHAGPPRGGTQTAPAEVLPKRGRPRKADRPNELPDQFSSNDIAKATGVSLRQLQWWDEQGIIPVTHRGHARVYTQDELDLIYVVARFRKFRILPRRAVLLIKQAARVGHSTAELLAALELLDKFRLLDLLGPHPYKRRA